MPGGTPPASGSSTGDIASGSTADSNATATGTTTSTVSQPPCSAAGLLACDDFETTAVGANPNRALWSLATTNGSQTLTVDTAHVYSGTRALHIHTTNNGYQSAQLVNTNIFPAANNSFYGRMFFYIDGDVPMTHTNFAGAAGVRPGESQQASYNYGAQFGPFLANYYDASNSSNIIDDWQHAGTDVGGVWQNATNLPSRKWTCLEWYFKGDTSEMHLWMDGQVVASMDVLGKSSQSNSNIPWTAPPFTQATMGWTVTSNSENFDHFDVYIDTVALGTQRIGCAP